MSAALLICAVLTMSDGDSGRCRSADGETIRVRLSSVEAGEVAPFTRCRSQPGIWACSPIARTTGPVAARLARELAANGARCAVTGRDRYGRLVVICTVAAGDLGRLMVRAGLARNEPRYGNRYAAEERAARLERKGIWR